MTIDSSRIVQYNDGEGLDYNDLNSMGREFLARILDSMLEHKAGRLAADDDPDMWFENDGEDVNLSSLVYTMTGGDCVLTGSGTDITIGCGTLFQKVGGFSGTEATFLPFQVLSGEGDVVLTIGAGHATNPRIDIIQVKLEWETGGSVSRDFEDAVTRELTTTTPNKSRRVKATFSVKAGTASATTPDYPAPDTGYAMIGAVRVPALWATGFSPDATGGSNAIIRQCTIPMGGIEAITVTPEEFDYSWATNWRPGVAGDGATINGTAYAAGGAGTNLVVWCPNAGQGKRIVGIDIVGLWVTSGTVLLRTMTWSSIGGYLPQDFLSAVDGSCDLSAQLVTTGGTTQSKFAHLGDIADASLVSDPSTAAGPVGDPFWACGGMAGPAFQKIQRNAGNLSGASWFTKAHLDIDGGSGSKIVAVTFYLAGP